jgi:hypothetical protein
MEFDLGAGESRADWLFSGGKVCRRGAVDDEAFGGGFGPPAARVDERVAVRVAQIDFSLEEHVRSADREKFIPDFVGHRSARQVVQRHFALPQDVRAHISETSGEFNVPGH